LLTPGDGDSQQTKAASRPKISILTRGFPHARRVARRQCLYQAGAKAFLTVGEEACRCRDLSPCLRLLEAAGPDPISGTDRQRIRGESMSKLRRIAEIPAGSWTKWVVVGFWLVVLVLALPLSTKLTGAEKNDAKYWLPGSAESTKVLDVQSRFQSPNVYTGVVVYVRPSGLTAADRAKAAADARMFAGVPGVVPGTVKGPIPSSDGQALQTVLQVNLGSKGWANANKAVDAIRAITTSNPPGLVAHITGPLGPQPTATTCSRASTAPCCSRPWPW
jgi:hypothetical protein